MSDSDSGEPSAIEILGAKLTPNQTLILEKLREMGGTVSVKRIAKATGLEVNVVYQEVDKLSRLQRIKVFFALPKAKTVFRFRTWEDVDHDHIAAMAKKGGVW